MKICYLHNNKPFDEATPEEATQKTGVKTGVKTRGKTREKILSLIRQDPTISAAEMAEKLGLTVKGVEWQLAKLKSDGAITRIGAANGGKWEHIFYIFKCSLFVKKFFCNSSNSFLLLFK